MNISIPTDMSNFSNFQLCKLAYADILRQHCDLIPENILKAFLFLTLFWLLIKVVTPISKNSIKDIVPFLKNELDSIFDRFISITETIALGFSIYGIIIIITQYGYTNISLFNKSLITFIIFIIISASIIYIADYFKKKRKNKNGDLRY